MSYLAKISIRLAEGAAAFSEEFRRRHGGYLKAAVNDDGGFSGRQGSSNAYYTSFALRGLAMLGCLDAAAASRAAGFLRRQLAGKMSSIDFFSLVMSDELLRVLAGINVWEGDDLARAKAVVARIEGYRRGDGGYAKTPSAHTSSVYHTFLALACKEFYDKTDPPHDGGDDVFELIVSRRRDDGGYVEIPQMSQSGTNPTAAAVAILRIIGRLDDGSRKDAADFLAKMQNDEGGFRANTRIPFADLLSTFTALTAIDGLVDGLVDDGENVVDIPTARRYVKSLEVAAGGFRGDAWDDSPDVEYAFYGLGTLALLNAEGGDNG
jgi:geranylgeranyl transferase type-2 subunit beta